MDNPEIRQVGNLWEVRYKDEERGWQVTLTCSTYDIAIEWAADLKKAGEL